MSPPTYNFSNSKFSFAIPAFHPDECTYPPSSGSRNSCFQGSCSQSSCSRNSCFRNSKKFGPLSRVNPMHRDSCFAEVRTANFPAVRGILMLCSQENKPSPALIPTKRKVTHDGQETFHSRKKVRTARTIPEEAKLGRRLQNMQYQRLHRSHERVRSEMVLAHNTEEAAAFATKRHFLLLFLASANVLDWLTLMQSSQTPFRQKKNFPPHFRI